ncbi:hypothetical protein MtrunA17_Chr2g0333051 [Medicago truncatula]|uniref:Transmembrane protein, putative n=1 Tax=Medicago truncatula TaxID=3880 RepID=Q2HUA1_MEDTR|nr:uncharacterized protein LOC11432517 [Medicago truncatula]ABD28733.1 hypothetical protein MtrDRAFT_AC149206g23v2 [Medicago truncatula]AES68147.1 transmembrane protein, putative [Medicago truncatula]RHN76522.1 hypothetical protein MtrunA17_Chr2g0333051 [Medicago truncatula]
MTSLSQGLVFTTAMLVSSTMLYLAFSKHKINPSFQILGSHVSHDPHTQILRSCLYSEEKKRERKMNSKKNKKKVRFEESVKESREKSEVAKKEKQRKRNRVHSNCRSEATKTRGIPANRMALYNGILRDRVHRIE